MYTNTCTHTLKAVDVCDARRALDVHVGEERTPLPRELGIHCRVESRSVERLCSHTTPKPHQIHSAPTMHTHILTHAYIHTHSRLLTTALRSRYKENPIYGIWRKTYVGKETSKRDIRMNRERVV